MKLFLVYATDPAPRPFAHRGRGWNWPKPWPTLSMSSYRPESPHWSCCSTAPPSVRLANSPRRSTPPPSPTSSATQERVMNIHAVRAAVPMAAYPPVKKPRALYD